jgi:Mrp family chromosome partitioning ATPase
VIEVHTGDGEEAESFRAIKARLKLSSPSDARGRSILVTSPNTGAGKTTVVGNQAHTLAEVGSTVVVVSADLRSNDVVERYWPQEAGLSGLPDYLVGPDLTVQKILSQTSESGVSLITRGSSSEVAIP